MARWLPRTITLQGKQGHLQQSLEVAAHCQGPFAVHEATHGAKLWTLTIISLGLALLYTTTKKDAQQIGETLLARCPKAFAHTDAEDLQRAIKNTKWAYTWLEKCYRDRRFYDP